MHNKKASALYLFGLFIVLFTAIIINPGNWVNLVLAAFLSLFIFIVLINKEYLELHHNLRLLLHQYKFLLLLVKILL